MKKLNLTKDKTNYIVVAHCNSKQKYFALIKVSDGLIKDLEGYLATIHEINEIGKDFILNFFDRKYVVLIHEKLLGGEEFKQEFEMNNIDGFAYALIDEIEFMKLQIDFERRFGSNLPELEIRSDMSFNYDFFCLDRESDDMISVTTTQLCISNFI